MMIQNKFLLGALVVAGTVLPTTTANELSYLTAPIQEWVSIAQPLSDGNQVALSPDEALLVATSTDGTISARDPETGNTEWSFRPTPLDGLPMFSTSGMTFSYNDEIGQFVVYGVSDGFSQADPSGWYVRTRMKEC